jgi:hypothetical protein
MYVGCKKKTQFDKLDNLWYKIAINMRFSSGLVVTSIPLLLNPLAIA